VSFGSSLDKQAFFSHHFFSFFLIIMVTSNVVEMGKGGGDENEYSGKKVVLPHVTTQCSNRE
jgi:hypothetical protein